jgi:carbonic anhydrase/acetyltransferase-like protein (isoleucine patch superfamily)
LDSHAGTLTRDVAHLEPLNRHRNILNLYDRQPTLSSTSYVAPNATVIGSVYAASNTVISFGATLKGDNYPVRIGKNTSIGENCVLECSDAVPDEAFPNSLNIGMITSHA